MASPPTRSQGAPGAFRAERATEAAPTAMATMTGTATEAPKGSDQLLRTRGAAANATTRPTVEGHTLWPKLDAPLTHPHA